MKTRPPNRAERVIAFLEQHYPAWIEATRFETVAGRCAWRTAISEARVLLKKRGEDIENRQHNTHASGRVWILSEYRLKRKIEPELVSVGHDLNVAPEGRLI
jgi:hypothetical protein